MLGSGSGLVRRRKRHLQRAQSARGDRGASRTVHGECMTIRQQWIVVGAIVATLGGGLFAATRILGSELFPIGVGSKAPAFSARTIDGPPRTKSIGDYRGQVVLLNIWATWCAPCRIEMPSIQALH